MLQKDFKALEVLLEPKELRALARQAQDNDIDIVEKRVLSKELTAHQA